MSHSVTGVRRAWLRGVSSLACGCCGTTRKKALGRHIHETVDNCSTVRCKAVGPRRDFVCSVAYICSSLLIVYIVLAVPMFVKKYLKLESFRAIQFGVILIE